MQEAVTIKGCSVMWMDDADDIREIRNEALRMKDDESVYDLSGRRIDSPSKPGLYIINGKKTIK